MDLESVDYELTINALIHTGLRINGLGIDGRGIDGLENSGRTTIATGIRRLVIN